MIKKKLTLPLTSLWNFKEIKCESYEYHIALRKRNFCCLHGIEMLIKEFWNIQLSSFTSKSEEIYVYNEEPSKWLYQQDLKVGERGTDFNKTSSLKTWKPGMIHHREAIKTTVPFV